MASHSRERLRIRRVRRRGTIRQRLKPCRAAKAFPQGPVETASQKTRSRARRSRLPLALRQLGRNQRKHSPRVRIHPNTRTRHPLRPANPRLPGLLPQRRQNHNSSSKTRRGRFSRSHHSRLNSRTRRSRYSSRSHHSRLSSRANCRRRHQNRRLLAASLVCRPAADLCWAARLKAAGEDGVPGQRYAAKRPRRSYQNFSCEPLMSDDQG
jgi:hypothetical protein